ncbi:ubiquinone/menaquinone biosynthesis methyltransferase-like protein [Planoprotostelium fungivorum]|uniref:Ubiquinone/menaquinone biosynthesis methyltransferase-like protein n=1 Tax=Planoprotostelium fungivorum TaxID=1890364 RepID=A0A2P6NMZ4_9EUKA|nr:ubiquinone/menaquinone biosynthesis methyltransferase-like protein [Planoprotostelium fungivorum]
MSRENYFSGLPKLQRSNSQGPNICAASRVSHLMLRAITNTGTRLPFRPLKQVRTMSSVRRVEKFSSTWPYTEQDLARYDESDDGQFYSSPRFVTHIDDGCIKTLTQYYGRELPPPNVDSPPSVIDLCSSWISHLPASYSTADQSGKRGANVHGVGMSEPELAANKSLKDFSVRDLNRNPIIPSEDASQDAIICSVSVDYLNRPREIFGEIGRVLKPGSRAHMSFSNRCFPTKVVGRWLQISERERTEMVADYFHFAGCPQKQPGELFDQIEIVTLDDGKRSDPLWVVRAQRR